jgi:mRNA interferase MazF
LDAVAPLRGDIWSVELDKRRLVVLLSAREGTEFQAIQLVPSAGTDLTGFGVEISVGIEEGLRVEEVVRFAYPRAGNTPCTWLTSVGREDLVERIGALTEAKMMEIDRGLRDAGLNPTTLLSTPA